jgi:hypothetical protein
VGRYLVSLVLLEKRLRHQGGGLILCHLQPAALDLFQYVRFNRLPDFLRTLDAKMPGSGPPRLLDPSWRSWKGRLSDFPILADALEAAGCTNADILAHCRGPGPHTRGCWIIDLIRENSRG